MSVLILWNVSEDYGVVSKQFENSLPWHSLIAVLEIQPKYPSSAKVCYAQETAASAAEAETKLLE